MVCRVAAGPWKEQSVQNRGGSPIAQERRGLREQAHAEEPFLIERQRRAVVSHQVIERTLRLARPPQPGMDVSPRAAQDRTSRIFGDEVGDPGLDLLEGSPTP